MDKNENKHCSLIIGKARVAPKKFVSNPRLEFVAAVLSVKISNMIKEQLQLQELYEYFWTDSRVALGYIANDTRDFKTFIANRVHMYKKIAMSCSGSMSRRRRIQQMTLPEV